MLRTTSSTATTQRRTFSIGTHISAENPHLASMVDVSDKRITRRTATARTRVHIPQSIVDVLFAKKDVTLSSSSNEVDPSTEGGDFYTKKGPVLNTAVVAGTMAVKNTAALIPFCHPLPIESCKITFTWSESSAAGRILEITCMVSTTNKTGIEMEALTGASVAGLCVYDMLKGAVPGGQQQSSETKPLMILDTLLLSKTGGKSDIKNV